MLSKLTQIPFNGTNFINTGLTQRIFSVWPVVGEMEMHSVANLATLQTPLATFSPKHSGYTFVLSVCVFPGNRTHDLCTANVMLYHWATWTRMFWRRAVLSCKNVNSFVSVNCSVQRKRSNENLVFLFHVSNRHEQVLWKTSITFETCLVFMLYVDYGFNNNKHTFA